MKLRITCNMEDGVRAWWNWKPILQFVFCRPGRYGLGIYIELPTDWHEDQKLELTIKGLIFFLHIGLPWFGKIYPDHSQCCGPRYGFQFFCEYLWLYYGQDTGHSKDPKRSYTVNMPWGWTHVRHDVLSKPESHPYRYNLKRGDVQDRIATIQVERREWRRKWLPWKRVSQYIRVDFSDEVGERSGSWKGGTVGCSYEMVGTETPVGTLRRMEQERTF